jgi:hypothetical protein
MPNQSVLLLEEKVPKADEVNNVDGFRTRRHGEMGTRGERKVKNEE